MAVIPRWKFLRWYMRYRGAAPSLLLQMREKVWEACRIVGIHPERIFLLDPEPSVGRKRCTDTNTGSHVVSVRELCAIGKGWKDGGQVEELRLAPGESNGDLLGFLAFAVEQQVFLRL